MPDHNASASTIINASPSTIFAILTDPRQHERIDGSGTVKGSVSGDTDLKLGSEFRMDMKMGAPYRINNRVVEFEPDRRIAWRHMGLHRWRYVLKPVENNQTRVSETWDVSAYPRPIAMFFSKVFRSRMQHSIDATLVRLKKAAESDETGTN
ncbi:MAG: SRPBCC family protein [Arachnia sp.]